MIAHLNAEARSQLTNFFAAEQTKGQLKSGGSPQSLALNLMSINVGMAVLARNGAAASELEETIEHVIASLVPSPVEDRLGTLPANEG